MIQSDGLTALDSQFNRLQMSVHWNVNTCINDESKKSVTSDSANDDGSILQLNSDSLIIELHEKLYQFH